MPRKLIICADGTWNAENNTDEGRPAPTNVLKIARALRPETRGGISQIIHYQSGVGRISPGALSAEHLARGCSTM